MTPVEHNFLNGIGITADKHELVDLEYLQDIHWQEWEDCEADQDDCAFGPDYQYTYDDEVRFADPGGQSALRAATARNPRDQPCPTCHAENVLTRQDVNLGYQCDACADMAENPHLQY